MLATPRGYPTSPSHNPWPEDQGFPCPADGSEHSAETLSLGQPDVSRTERMHACTPRCTPRLWQWGCFPRSQACRVALSGAVSVPATCPMSGRPHALTATYG